MTSKTLAHVAAHTVAKHTTKPSAAPQPLKLKQVLIIDSGDGAFTDASVKVKPADGNPAQMVFKCTDKARLLTQLAASGITPIKVVKGSKHFIAFVHTTDVTKALPGNAQKTFSADHKVKFLK